MNTPPPVRKPVKTVWEIKNPLAIAAEQIKAMDLSGCVIAADQYTLDSVAELLDDGKAVVNFRPATEKEAAETSLFGYVEDIAIDSNPLKNTDGAVCRIFTLHMNEDTKEIVRRMEFDVLSPILGAYAAIENKGFRGASIRASRLALAAYADSSDAYKRLTRCKKPDKYQRVMYPNMAFSINGMPVFRDRGKMETRGVFAEVVAPDED